MQLVHGISTSSKRFRLKCSKNQVSRINVFDRVRKSTAEINFQKPEAIIKWFHEKFSISVRLAPTIATLSSETGAVRQISIINLHHMVPYVAKFFQGLSGRLLGGTLRLNFSQTVIGTDEVIEVATNVPLCKQKNTENAIPLRIPVTCRRYKIGIKRMFLKRQSCCSQPLWGLIVYGYEQSGRVRLFWSFNTLSTHKIDNF